jgi:tetratricopeptide (TPR) repeat protein
MFAPFRTRFLCLILFGMEGIALCDAPPPLKEMLAAYRESDQLARTMSEGERLAHYRDWLQRLLPIVEPAPAGPEKESALATCSMIANALGDFQVSRRLLEQLVDATSSRPAEQVQWLTELGEVSILQYQQEKQPAIREAAVESLQKANVIFKSGAKDLQSDSWEQHVLNLCWLGDMLRSGTPGADDFAESANAYSLALQTLSEHDAPTGRLAGKGYDAEHINQSEAGAAISSGDKERAYAALTRISELPDKRWPASFYVEQVASKAFPEGKADFREFLQKWVSNHPDDERTAALLFAIAQSYHYSKMHDEALAIYLLIDEKYSMQLIALDGKMAAEGRGGRYATALQDMREIYFRFIRRMRVCVE